MRIGRIALVVALVVALAGCSYFPRSGTGGLSHEQARAQLEGIEGVTKAYIITDDWVRGDFFIERGLDIRVTIGIAEGYRIVDPAEFMDFVLATVWSVHDTLPYGHIDVDVQGGVRPHFDWTAIVAELGFEPVDFFDTRVTTAEMEKLYGEWPHSPVPRPVGLLENAPFTDDDLLEDAISPVFMRAFAVDLSTGRNACFSPDFTRNPGANGSTFAGEITIDLLREGQRVTSVTMPGDAEYPSAICLPAAEVDPDALYRVRATARDDTGAFRSVVKQSNALKPELTPAS
jgi:hypothetical protein